MAFRVGQKVECVDDGNCRNPRAKNTKCPFKMGGIYTVATIDPIMDPYGDYGLHFYEVAGTKVIHSSGAFEIGWCQRRFRPVVSTDTGMAILEQIRRDVSDRNLRPIFEDEQT